MLSSRLQQHFQEYADYHQHKVNLLIHKIAVPLIVFHIVAMLNWIKIFSWQQIDVTLAWFASTSVAIYYFSLNVKLALWATLYIIFCYFVSLFTPHWLVWFIAISAWTAQFIGHFVWEKKSPAFFKNMLQALIGPLYILEKLSNRSF